MKKIVFITGGARSGKSRFALENSSIIPGKKAFIATAEATDEEMLQRIEKHIVDRGGTYDTFEEPFGISDLLKKIDGAYRVVIIDCLTLWMANLIWRNANIAEEVDKFIATLKGLAGDSLISIVSNEVGMGIVPENETARRYRDLAGFLNQKVAAAADEVYLAVSGIPVKIKG
jgi:adenosylcobinamide kinase/adenosylcobinamide-phosphate guanylyltransferase